MFRTLCRVVAITQTKIWVILPAYSYHVAFALEPEIFKNVTVLDVGFRFHAMVNLTDHRNDNTMIFKEIEL